MKIYAESKKEKEVYECTKEKIVADVQSHYRISQLEASNKIIDSTIDAPLDLPDCVVWCE